MVPNKISTLEYRISADFIKQGIKPIGTKATDFTNERVSSI